jgi:hypothetical protein
MCYISDWFVLLLRWVTCRFAVMDSVTLLRGQQVPRGKKVLELETSTDCMPSGTFRLQEDTYPACLYFLFSSFFYFIYIYIQPVIAERMGVCIPLGTPE